MEFRLAFLNCWSLYEVEQQTQRKTAPKTSAEFDARVTNLAATLHTLFPGNCPDIIGLCEVGSRSAGEQLGHAVKPNTYFDIWSGTPPYPLPPTSDTGLMILYRPDRLQYTQVTPRIHGLNQIRRARWMAGRFQLQSGSQPVFHLVVNHWKSDYRTDATVWIDREESAQEIAQDFLLAYSNMEDSFIVVGDFNCEPYASPFCQSNVCFKGERERALVLRGDIRNYFYNPMWRLLGEPDHYDTARQPGYQPPRPPGTYLPSSRKNGWKTLDQMLVTKPLLSGGGIHFLESSLRVVRPQGRASDHAVIGAVFEFS